MCPKTIKHDHLNQYVKEVLKDKPVRNNINPTKKSTYTILQLSDPHVDLEYKEVISLKLNNQTNYDKGTDAFCSSSYCCREESGAAPNKSHAAGHWGTIAQCDIPYVKITLCVLLQCV